MFGLALAIFLAFRNNASYARYIEGRHLWDNLLIASRALMSQMLCYLPGGAAEAQRLRLAHELIALSYALKHQLRRSDPMPDFIRLLGAERAAQLQNLHYQAIAILNSIRQSLADGQAVASLPAAALWMFDQQLNELGDAIGGCERIASTPIPFSYSVLLHRTVYSYCILLPFGLVDSTEFFTPLICVLIAYTLVALEAIANEVAEPFGLAPNALALDSLSRNIERSILELCGRELPEETAPERPYQLMWRILRQAGSGQLAQVRM